MRFFTFNLGITLLRQLMPTKEFAKSAFSSTSSTSSTSSSIQEADEDRDELRAPLVTRRGASLGGSESESKAKKGPEKTKRRQHARSASLLDGRACSRYTELMEAQAADSSSNVLQQGGSKSWIRKCCPASFQSDAHPVSASADRQKLRTHHLPLPAPTSTYRRSPWVHRTL
jgi:hypothetical protein